MRRVLHLKMVTQCAMLEEFGIFLVLADKVRSIIRLNGSMGSEGIYFTVVVRVSHRGTCAFNASKCSRFSNAAEAERKQGRALLPRRHSEQPHLGYLHEEERRSKSQLLSD